MQKHDMMISVKIMSLKKVAALKEESTTEQDLLQTIQELRKTRDLDEISELMTTLIAMFGLTVAEVAALNYYTLKQALETPVNTKWFKERMKLDVTNLSVEGTLKVQEALVNVFVSELTKRDT